MKDFGPNLGPRSFEPLGPNPSVTPNLEDVPNTQNEQFGSRTLCLYADGQSSAPLAREQSLGTDLAQYVPQNGLTGNPNDDQPNPLTGSPSKNQLKHAVSFLQQKLYDHRTQAYAVLADQRRGWESAAENCRRESEDVCQVEVARAEANARAQGLGQIQQCEAVIQRTQIRLENQAQTQSQRVQLLQREAQEALTSPRPAPKMLQVGSESAPGDAPGSLVCASLIFNV